MTELPAGWTDVELGEVCEVNPKPRSLPGIDDEVAFLGMASVHANGTTDPGELRRFGDVSKGYTQFERGDVLVAKITPCFENGKIAQAASRTPVATGSTEFHVVRPREDVDARYVLHYLRQPWVRLAGERRMTGSGGQRRVPTSFVASLTIPLPPLGEQRRIAAILDKAVELQAKRRDALRQLTSVTESHFLDLLTDHPGIPYVTVESVAAPERGAIRTGPFGSQLLHSEFVGEGVRVLGIDNVVTNEFRWAEPRYITHEKHETLRRFTVHPGDVLVTIMGTCGRAAVVPDDVPVAINTKHLCGITVDRAVAEPRWLHAALLYDRTTRRQLGERAKGAVMPGLNMGLIKATLIPLPAFEVQRKFVARLEAVEQLKARASRGDAELDALFVSLQSRAFRGEL